MATDPGGERANAGHGVSKALPDCMRSEVRTVRKGKGEEGRQYFTVVVGRALCGAGSRSQSSGIAEDTLRAEHRNITSVQTQQH